LLLLFCRFLFVAVVLLLLVVVVVRPCISALLLLHLGLILIDDKSAMEQLLKVLDSMWKLLFIIYSRGGVKIDERHAVELIDSLLLLLNPKHKDPINVRDVVITAIRVSFRGDGGGGGQCPPWIWFLPP
jgi:hypothetical protein